MLTMAFYTIEVHETRRRELKTTDSPSLPAITQVRISVELKGGTQHSCTAEATATLSSLAVATAAATDDDAKRKPCIREEVTRLMLYGMKQFYHYGVYLEGSKVSQNASHLRSTHQAESAQLCCSRQDDPTISITMCNVLV